MQEAQAINLGSSQATTTPLLLAKHHQDIYWGFGHLWLTILSKQRKNIKTSVLAKIPISFLYQQWSEHRHHGNRRARKKTAFQVLFFWKTDLSLNWSHQEEQHCNNTTGMQVTGLGKAAALWIRSIWEARMQTLPRAALFATHLQFRDPEAHPQHSPPQMWLPNKDG